MTVIDSTIPSGPFVSLGVQGAITTTRDLFTQSSSVANPDSSSASNTGTIAGVIAGMIGGLAIGVTFAFLAFCWWSKRNQQKRWPPGSDGMRIPLHSDSTPPPAYLGASPPYSPESAMVAVTGHHSVPSALVGTSPQSTVPVQISMNGGTEMAHAQRTLSPPPRVRLNTRCMGNRQPNPFVSAPSSSAQGIPPSPEGTRNRETMLPAYS